MLEKKNVFVLCAGFSTIAMMHSVRLYGDEPSGVREWVELNGCFCECECACAQEKLMRFYCNKFNSEKRMCRTIVLRAYSVGESLFIPSLART